MLYVQKCAKLESALAEARAALARLIAHCEAVAADLNEGLAKGWVAEDVYDELSHAQEVADGRIDPYVRGGRIPY